MTLEIERKFLVATTAWQKHAEVSRFIYQFYLAISADCEARVRIVPPLAELTVKRKTPDPMIRSEFTVPVDYDAALELETGKLGQKIEKYRSLVPHGDLTWEIDSYLGANDGLIVAEIELPSVDHEFARPSWLGEEVTGDKRYANQSLALNPFTTWEDAL